MSEPSPTYHRWETIRCGDGRVIVCAACSTVHHAGNHNAPCVAGAAPTDMVADFAGWLDANFGAAAFASDRAETVEEGIARAQRARQRLLANGAKLVTHETIAAEMNAEREALIAAHRGHVRVTCDNCPMEQGASADCVTGCTAPLAVLWADSCELERLRATSEPTEITDAEFREEARRRGYELHSAQFSKAAQTLIREIPELRKRLDALETMATEAGHAEAKS
jgi:hypothetical protein